MASSERKTESKAGMSGLQKLALTVFLLLLVGSVTTRVLRGERADQVAQGAGSGSSELSNDFFGQGTGPSGGSYPGLEQPTKSSDNDKLEKALPYVTEASLFALIGFALGYTSRKIFKVALIGIALLFVAIQAMVGAGWMQVDWGGVIEKMNSWIFNLKQHENVSEFMTRLVPSAGSLGFGWVTGFKRG